MSHVVVPPGQLSNGWFENALHDTASCGGCGAQLDVYTTDKAFAGKPAVSTWVCAHKLEDCVRHLRDAINSQTTAMAALAADAIRFYQKFEKLEDELASLRKDLVSRTDPRLYS